MCDILTQQQQLTDNLTGSNSRCVTSWHGNSSRKLTNWPGNSSKCMTTCPDNSSRCITTWPKESMWPDPAAARGGGAIGRAASGRSGEPRENKVHRQRLHSVQCQRPAHDPPRTHRLENACRKNECLHFKKTSLNTHQSTQVTVILSTHCYTRHEHTLSLVYLTWSNTQPLLG